MKNSRRGRLLAQVFSVHMVSLTDIKVLNIILGSFDTFMIFGNLLGKRLVARAEMWDIL